MVDLGDAAAGVDRGEDVAGFAAGSQRLVRIDRRQRALGPSPARSAR